MRRIAREGWMVRCPRKIAVRIAKPTGERNAKGAPDGGPGGAKTGVLGGVGAPYS